MPAEFPRATHPKPDFFAMDNAKVSGHHWRMAFQPQQVNLAVFSACFSSLTLLHWKGLPAAELAASAPSVAGLVFTVLMLPETKGKSLEELPSERSTPVERGA